MPTTPPDKDGIPDDIPDGPAAAKKGGRQRRSTMMGTMPPPGLADGGDGPQMTAMNEPSAQEDATVAFVLTPELLAKMGEPVLSASAKLPDDLPSDLPGEAPSAPSAAPQRGAAQARTPQAASAASAFDDDDDSDRTVAFVPPPELFADLDKKLSKPLGGHRHAGTEAYSPEPAAPVAAAEPAPASESGGHRHSATEAYIPSEPLQPAAAKSPAPPSPSAKATAPAAPATPAPSASPTTRPGSPSGKGISLLEILRKSGGMNGEDAVKLMCRIATEVQKLHDAKNGHGGLTPAHVLFVPDVDGAVQLVPAEKVKVKERFSVQYEAPELSGGVKTETVQPVRSDVYALGCILFEMLTGKAPFRAKTPEDIRKRHAKFAVPAARQIRADVEMPPALEVQLQRAMKKRPADRPACAGDFAQAIAYATADDDRGTVHLQGDQAKLLQELIQQKTESHAFKQELEEKTRSAEAEKAAASQQKQAAVKQSARAIEEAARAAEESARAEQDQASAKRSKKRWISIAVGGLLLGLGTLGALYFAGVFETVRVEEKEVEKLVEVEKIVTRKEIVEKEVEKIVEVEKTVYIERDAGPTPRHRSHARRKPKPKPAAAPPPPPPPPKANDGPAVF